MPSSSAPGSVPYDASTVAAGGRQADPGLPEDEAARLATEALPHLRAVGCDDVAAVARLLLDSTSDVSHANVIARAAVDFCREHDVDLSG